MILIGVCVVVLGIGVVGVMMNDDEFVVEFLIVLNFVGEVVW